MFYEEEAKRGLLLHIYLSDYIHYIYKLLDVNQQFSITTGATSLQRHLSSEHGLFIAISKKRKEAIQIALAKKQKHTKIKLTKMTLGAMLVKWFATDMLPFSTVNKAGFRNFLKSVGTVENLDVLPSEAYLRLYALTDVYQTVKEKIIEKTSSVEFVGIEFDLWKDNYFGNSYNGITMTFIDSDWQKKNITLRIGYLPNPHTAKIIKDDVLKCLKEHKIEQDKCFAVTDNAANVIAAFKFPDVNIQHASCIGHGIHLLIKADSCDRVKEVTDAIKALNSIHTSIVYRKRELFEIIEAEKEKQTIQKIIRMGNI